MLLRSELDSTLSSGLRIKREGDTADAPWQPRRCCALSSIRFRIRKCRTKREGDIADGSPAAPTLLRPELDSILNSALRMKREGDTADAPRQPRRCCVLSSIRF